MINFVYVLAFLTSTACAVLLLRAYLRARGRLLFWTFLGFTGLAANALLMWIDVRVLPPQIDLSVWRLVPAVVGLACLCYGLIWETA